MKFLVLQPLKTGSKVSIAKDESVLVTGPFDSWALADGRQVDYVLHKMARHLAQYHIHGTFEAGAMYGYDYQELRSLLIHKLGPTDEQRYQLAVQGIDSVSKFKNFVHRYKWAWVGLGAAGTIAMALLFGFITLVLNMGLIALFIKFLSKPK